MKELSRAARMVRVIRRIPRGKVATYGQIATLSGNPRDARAVGWVLHSHWKKEKLPWQRVINREGKISLKHGEGYELQKALLQGEGVRFDRRGRVDLAIFQWKPKFIRIPSRRPGRPRD